MILCPSQSLERQAFVSRVSMQCGGEPPKSGSVTEHDTVTANTSVCPTAGIASKRINAYIVTFFRRSGRGIILVSEPYTVVKFQGKLSVSACVKYNRGGRISLMRSVSVNIHITLIYVALALPVQNFAQTLLLSIYNFG